MTAQPRALASTQEVKFRKLLEELFMFDQAELDFGIYRIMNARRAEITAFLEHDLLPRAREALGAVEGGERDQLRIELEKAIENARALDMDPELVPRVQELRARYGSGPDSTALEAEVFSHLYSFFRRYYSDGDFISQRRYKEGVYAIPYEGEEVKLYWANHDQYYIKSGENFRDYTFKLADRRRVHFKLVNADTERNDNKAAAGQERRFALAEEEPLLEEAGELVIRFTYQPDPQKRRQNTLNDDAVSRITAAAPPAWRTALTAQAPTERDPNRTILAKHLADYTARNTFDYFIHKDLGGFLRRELDFYIKNEVVHLDDIEHETASRVEQYLGKVRAIRRIAHQIIDFLAQLEDFQKKLWLKKKFVVETNYCITLDRIPEELYPEIAANDAQREEWVRLFAIDEIEAELGKPGYSVPLTVEFLKANPFLVVDTAFFGEGFKDRVLGNVEDLDEETDGVLVHSENFQALNQLNQRYIGQVACVFIDPPYNTGINDFPYKDSFQHSSWLAMMANRLTISRSLQQVDGVLAITIDDGEVHRLRELVQGTFGAQNFVANVIWQKKYARQNDATWFSTSHDHVLFTAKNSDQWRPRRLPRTAAQNKSYANPDNDPRGPWQSVVYTCNKTAEERPNLYYPIKNPKTGEEVWPDRKRVWAYDESTHARLESENRVWWGLNGELDKPRRKVFLAELNPGTVPDTIWSRTDVGDNQDAQRELAALGLSFPTPKPVRLVQRIAQIGMGTSGQFLDFFAGSGTTGHAIVALNREDSGNRKYVLIEMGDHFHTILKPRIQKVIYSKDWKAGKPISREGSSHLFKYVRLESYEDTLNNLELRRTQDQQELLDSEDDFRRDYLLHYMLDVESRGSASLLNLDRFEDPFNYELQIGTGSAGETRPTKVDLVETFNYLLGLRVKHIDRIRGIRVVQGTSPAGERVLVLWRNTREVSNAELDTFFQKQGYNTRDGEFDLIYVNGDNNLENLRRPDETWKVRLIEEEFFRLMFDVQDI